MEKEKINALEMENKELKAENVGLKEELEELKLQVASFQKMIFGPRSEKTSKKENLVEGEQSSLFDEEFKELSEKIQEQITGRKASSNSYMWVARTGELEKKSKE